MTNALLRIRGALCWFGIALCLLAILSPSPAQATPERGFALIGVRSDLTRNNAPDEVMIQVLGNRDTTLLTNLAGELGTKFGANPMQVKIGTGNSSFVPENEIGLTCFLPIMARSGGTLPIAPFIEVFAPYASELRIVYLVNGHFTYQGPRTFENEDVSITVDAPELAPDSAIPFAFYGMDVKIKNPSLTSVHIEDQPAPSAPRPLLARVPMWVVVIFAGAFGAAFGLILWQFMPRHPKPRTRPRRSAPTRETRTHAGTRNDESQ